MRLRILKTISKMKEKSKEKGERRDGRKRLGGANRKLPARQVIYMTHI